MYLEEVIPVVDDLQRLVGRRLEAVWQSTRDRLCLQIGDTLVLLVPRGPFARLSSPGRRTKSPQRPFSFQGACRRHLGGLLTALTVVDGDRQVRFTFTHGTLLLRLTGRGGGLWLFADDTLVAAYDGPAAALPELPAGSPTGRTPRFAAPSGDWAKQAERWFATQERESSRSSELARVARVLKDERNRLVRLDRNLGRDVATDDVLDRKRRAADALAAVLHRIPERAREAHVPDLLHPETVHHIPLRPGTSLGAQLSRMYDRVKRLEDRSAQAGERLGLIAEQLRTLAVALEALESGEPEPARRLVGEVPQRRRQSDAAGDVLRWRGPRGRELWVGRDAKGNRRLTFQLARGRDWWMHVRGRPGAHVILPVRSGGPPPLDWLLAGAQLAARRSRIAAGDSVDVQYTQVKHVRAIPGDNHGRVTVHDERVLHIRREDTLPEGWTPVE